ALQEGHAILARNLDNRSFRQRRQPCHGPEIGERSGEGQAMTRFRTGWPTRPMCRDRATSCRRLTPLRRWSRHFSVEPERYARIYRPSPCLATSTKGLSAMRLVTALAAIVSLSLLGACGHREPERAEGGAAAGAASGAAIGALAGPPGVVGGALIGGAAGGVTAAATKPNDVNLGPPPWQDNSRAGQHAARHMAN